MRKGEKRGCETGVRSLFAMIESFDGAFSRVNQAVKGKHLIRFGSDFTFAFPFSFVTHLCLHSLAGIHQEGSYYEQWNKKFAHDGHLERVILYSLSVLK
jgi:hypothetical protein